MKFYHSDPIFHQALEQAYWELNPTGMHLFYDKIEMYDRRRGNIVTLEDWKVKETYSSAVGVYDVDGDKCTCSAFGQHFYCRHIVYFRVQNQLPIFELSSFHPSLRKSVDNPHNIEDKQSDSVKKGADVNGPTSPGLKMVTEAVRKKKPPTQAKKYNIAFDAVKEIAEILAIYDEHAFNTYLEASKSFTKLLRSGLPDILVNFLKSPGSYNLVTKPKMQPIVIDDDDEPQMTKNKRS